nr:hypothetical protein [Propionicimonas sp.]
MANEQMRRDSIEQTRPYVFAEVLPGLGGPAAFDLRITNSGKSTARMLTLTPSEWPDRDDAVTTSLRELMETPRTLPPGCSIRAVWRVGPPPPGYYTDGPDEMGMNARAAISVKYQSDESRHYDDTFDVNADGAGLWPVPESGPDAKTLEGDVRLFYNLGQSMVRRIGELGR